MQLEHKKLPAPPGMGHIRKGPYSWYGEIRIQGRRFGKGCKSREVVEAWLDEMRRTAREAREAKEAQKAKEAKKAKEAQKAKKAQEAKEAKEARKAKAEERKKSKEALERNPNAARPFGEGSIQRRGKSTWTVSIKRNGQEYRKNVKTLKEARAWIEEQKTQLPAPLVAQTTKGSSLISKDYQRIHEACDEGREENIKKYAAMSAEAKVAAEAARVRRDAAAARIRELRALLGIGAN